MYAFQNTLLVSLVAGCAGAALSIIPGATWTAVRAAVIFAAILTLKPDRLRPIQANTSKPMAPGSCKPLSSDIKPQPNTKQ